MTRITCHRFSGEDDRRAAAVPRVDRPAWLTRHGWVQDAADSWHRPAEPEVIFTTAAAVRDGLRERS